MDYLDEWSKNRDASCLCDWCVGQFETVNGGGWKKTRWAITAKKHIVGVLLCPDDAKCSEMIHTQPVISTISFLLKTGFNCKLCNFKNDYAESNQSDGTYICFNCR